VRSVKAADNWRTVYRRRYENSIDEINLNGLLGINAVNFHGGIFAICGLNGAGKSTIISAIKDVLGLPKTEQDKRKLGTSTLSAKITVNSAKMECQNSESLRAIDRGISQDLMKYIDHGKATKSIEYLYTQKNIDELIEQNEEYTFSPNELSELSCLVGKNYLKASVVEINDIEGLGTIPYFQVTVASECYSSIGMGIGEHFLFYMFWELNKIEKNGIIIIEEPETFIGIASQQCLMNYIASIVADNGAIVILTTHSPFILMDIPYSHIIIVSRFQNIPSLITPSLENTAISYLGAVINQKGTIFVEDVAAKTLLICLLEKQPSIIKSFSIDVVDGESEITKRLKFPRSEKINYLFIGVYDADMKDRINSKSLGIEWPYTFMPGSENIEKTFRNILGIQENIEKLCLKINKKPEAIIAILAKNDGIDPHDWLINVARDLSIDQMILVRCILYIWYENSNKEIDEFLLALEKIIYPI
jgi:predicted ATPase